MFSRDSEDLTDRSGFNGTKAHWNKRRRRKRGDSQNPIKIEEDEEGEKASKEDDRRKGKDNDKEKGLRMEEEVLGSKGAKIKIEEEIEEEVLKEKGIKSGTKSGMGKAIEIETNKEIPES